MLTIVQVNENELKFIGRLDASQADTATNALSIYDETLTIEMSELTYISSMGLSVLVNTYKRLNEKGFTLRLLNVNNHIRDIFKYTRLDQIFDIVEN